MFRKEWLVVIFFLIGILFYGVTVIITFTLDQGRQSGPAFSLAHHYPETIGFFVLSVGFGIGFGIRDKRIRILFKIVSIILLLGYTILAILQIKGIQLIGTPWFVPLVIVGGYAIGYMTDRHLYRRAS